MPARLDEGEAMRIEWLDRTAIRTPYLTLCLTERQYLQVVKLLKVPRPVGWMPDECAACVQTFNSPQGGIACVVCLDESQHGSSLEIVESLVHEAVHVWQACRDRMGETNVGKEIEAYAIQNICATLFESYVKQTSCTA